MNKNHWKPGWCSQVAFFTRNTWKRYNSCFNSLQGQCIGLIFKIPYSFHFTAAVIVYYHLQHKIINISLIFPEFKNHIQDAFCTEVLIRTDTIYFNNGRLHRLLGRSQTKILSSLFIFIFYHWHFLLGTHTDPFIRYSTLTGSLNGGHILCVHVQKMIF